MGHPLDDLFRAEPRLPLSTSRMMGLKPDSQDRECRKKIIAFLGILHIWSSCRDQCLVHIMCFAAKGNG